MPFSYPVFGEGLLVSYYLDYYYIEYVRDLRERSSVVELDDVCVCERERVCDLR